VTVGTGRVVLDGTDIAHATPHDRVRLVVQDEAAEGIHPSSSKDIGWVVRHLADVGLKSQRMTVILVEHHDDFGAALDDPCLLMQRGDLPPESWRCGSPLIPMGLVRNRA
jgi:ABC-type branched-subunit amino acid transport system ATPase component